MAPARSAYKLTDGDPRTATLASFILSASIAALADRLIEEGYAIDNIAFGMGGGLLQQVNRDTLRFAMKANAMRDDTARGVTCPRNPPPIQEKQRDRRQAVLNEGGPAGRSTSRSC